MLPKSLPVFICLSLYAILFDNTNAECPLGWHHFGSSCYLLGHEHFNWLQAEFSCRAHNARLAEVQSKAQSDFLVNMCRTEGPGQSYWLGGRDDVIEGRWMWAQTDRLFNFTSWYPNVPDNFGGNENCLHMYAPHGLKWNDAPCTNPYRFICEKDKSNSECPLGWTHYGMSCFFFSHESFVWFVSQSSCRAHNSRLAEVVSKTQSDLLMNLAKTNGPGQSYWLGGRDDVIEGIWMWASTDRALNYTYWYPGQPDNGGGNENCLHMSAPWSLKWNDTPCTSTNRFICEKEYSDDGGSEIIG